MGNLKYYGWRAVLMVISQLMNAALTAPSASGQELDVQKFIYDQVHHELKGRAPEQALMMSKTIVSASRENGLNPILVLSVIATESRFRASVVGSHGEIGLMQLKPDTARWVAQQAGLPWRGSASLKDPSVNIKLGAAYLAYLSGEFESRRELYLTAYNMGAGKLRQLLRLAHVPRIYASKVLRNYTLFQAKQAKLARNVASR